MNLTYKNFSETFHPSRILIAFIIGVGVVAFFLIRDYKPGMFDTLQFTSWSFLFLFLATLCMITRDLGYIIRLRILSDNKISWLKAFRIIMLWEFTSAITPSAIGGTGFAVIFLTKEGTPVGRSTAIVLTTSLLDEFYFLIMFPILLLAISPDVLFSTNKHINNNVPLFANELFWFAFLGYSLKLFYFLLVSYGLLFKPRAIKWIFIKLFSLPFLRKWRNSAAKAGDDVIISAQEFRHKNFMYWVKAFIATFFSWSSRYLVVNMIFLAFFIVPDHFLLFARQLAMWIMMLVSPTPGGSGFAEFIFSRYLNDLLGGIQSNISIIIVLAFIWRLFSYYPYLFIGSLILPGWIKRKFIDTYKH